MPAKAVASMNLSLFRLPITQDDIDYAVPRNQFNCAIVRAIQRRYPTALVVKTSPGAPAGCTRATRNAGVRIWRPPLQARLPSAPSVTQAPIDP